MRVAGMLPVPVLNESVVIDKLDERAGAINAVAALRLRLYVACTHHMYIQQFSSSRDVRNNSVDVGQLRFTDI